MKQEAMISNKHNDATPRTSAASTIGSLFRKRNRSSKDRGELCTIESEAFKLVVPKLDKNDIPHRCNRQRPFSESKGRTTLPQPQQVGVFGVDSGKRINMWNDSAAEVTGALPTAKDICDLTEEEEDVTDDDSTEERIIGMQFDDLFPSSSFELSTEESPLSVSFGDVLDKVFQTGVPSLAVPITAKAGRKRGRDEISDSMFFIVDFLPQFGPSPPTVSGVVMVCRSDMIIRKLFDREENERNQLIDITHSITTSGDADKPRSLSAGSSGTSETCPTLTEADIEKELEAEIDDSFQTCAIDLSSQHTYPIDQSFQTVITKNKRLDELEAFESPLPAPPIVKRIGSTDDEDYRMLFETVDSIIFGVDLDGNINEWNYRMEELTGIQKESVFGHSMLTDTSLPFLPYRKFSHLDSLNSNLTFRGEVEPVLSKSFNGKSSSDFMMKVKRANQQDQGKQQAEKMSHIIASVSPRYNHREEIIGVLFLAQDQTEGFTHFHSIRTEAHELRTLIDTANAPIFGINAQGYINEWNEKTAEITGYGKDEASGCLLVDTFICSNNQDSVRDILQNALEHEKGTSNYELEFRTKCDKIRHLLVNITPKHDMNNVVIGAVLIAQDVTEAVERDRAVASMALELRQLIETANAPIFGIDVHGKVNEWNTRMSTLTGFSKEEASQTPLLETFIAPSMKEKVGEILEAALNGNETSNYEVEVTSKSGEPIFLLVNATTRRDPDKNVIGVVGVAQDVTEDRKHSKALRELETIRASQEAKVETERNMTAYFAHELRNPLGAIDSALAAMPDKIPENIQSLVSGMQLCTKFMKSIMDNLLDVRKMEEGKMRLGKGPVSINKMLDDVHKMLSPSIRPGVEFRKVINVKGNDWVTGDAHRIEQVMTNVISNAIKYTVSGHIQISVEWENENVKFVCEDTGPGIPKSEQEKLFQRFVQRGGAPGTGLGLAIAKHIVDLTGGSIRFESDPDIKAGTTCVVLMGLPPCKKPASSVKQKTEFINEPLSFLIIDDIKMNRTMFKRRILKGIAPNAKIQEAATGEEALLICGKEKFDVMIVDQYMEGAGGVMVGTDVVFAMRRMRIDSVLIGCSGNDIGAQFIDAGADMVWQKPMPKNEQIIKDLRSSLDKRGIVQRRTSFAK